MKRVLCKVVVAVTLGWVLITPGVVKAEEISIVANEWCPYNCDPTSSEPGFLVEIAEYGLKRGGHEVRYSVLPWSRAVEETREGKHHALAGAYRSDAPDFVFPKESMGYSSNHFYVLATSRWRFEDYSSLARISLGAIQGYTYAEELDAYIAENRGNASKVQLVSGEDALDRNIQKLMGGRIDAYIEDRWVIEHYLKKVGKVGTLRSAGELPGEDIFVAFSPANPKSAVYAQLVDEGLRELRASGQLTAILGRYGVIAQR